MGYKMDMSKESAPKVVLPKGWREFVITTAEEQTSKKGNMMFKITFFDQETQTPHDVYAIATEGKRWFLKQILSACNLEAGQDGVYDWDIKDIQLKTVLGRVEHEDNKWIDRTGVERSAVKSVIVEVKPLDAIKDVDLDKEEVPF